MYSMTGYGKGEFCSEDVEVRVEVRSVNNRYLDILLKCPRVFLSAEEHIRSLVRKKISRGHLDIYVNYLDKRDRVSSLIVDENAAKGYYAAAEKLSNLLPSLENDLTLSAFMRLPDVVRTEDREGADDVLLSALDSALLSALSAVSEMRKREGERLKADLLARLETISALRDRIAARAPLVSEEYRKKLTERITEFLGGKVDETRILTEAAVFADKCNIDEELTRISSHIREFREVSEEERVGKQLDFLVQEFNRECNTICSKSNDKEITAAALEMKNEIEKVREQIQNLE